MTAFVKEDFVWDGSYLMYYGRHEDSVNMEVARPNILTVTHRGLVNQNLSLSQGSSTARTSLGRHGLTS